MEASPFCKLLLFLFLLYSLDVITMSYTSNTTNSCHDHERSALLRFEQSFSAFSGSSAYLKTASWKARGSSSSDCCSWDGVDCDDATGYIIGLDLSGSLIDATLHSNSTLFSLVHLQNLNLAENNFMNSRIPPEISHLSSLSFINLSCSSFSGQIPLELSGMSKLVSLDLSSNYFYGDIPIAIFNLPSLLVLNVSFNQNLRGYLPEFNKTSPLRELDTAFTKFSGTIPSSIGYLQSLTRLQLKECYFSGSIPASIGNLTQLTHLSVASNMFNNSGDLSWLHKLTKLTVLNLNDTNLCGDIPPSLANLTQLTGLYLSNNPFNKSSNLSWLDKLAKLTVLNLGNSNLYGHIPPSFANLSHLTSLYLDRNHFAGEIPPPLANLTQLTSLYLKRNYFAGKIPLWLMNMTQITELDFGFNKLTGQIPPSLSQLKNLEHLSLTANNFTGTVEADIFLKFINLTFLDLSQCKITLLAPHHLNFTFQKLEVLGMESCSLTEVPYFLQFQSNLRVLDLDQNNIHGSQG